MVTHPFRPGRLTPERASEIAVEALSFLASDPERIGGFLAQSGLAPGELRQASANPGFLPAILDYLCADEAILREFSAESRHAPETVDAARQILHGPQPDWGA